MFRDNKEAIYHSENFKVWMALAFQGGFINMLGLLSVHHFVSHITGFAGHFAESIFHLKWVEALAFFSVPIFFLAGAIISGFFTEVRREKGNSPIYIYSMLCMCAIFICLTVIGTIGFFGEFGESVINLRDFILLSALSFACGLQNALFTSASGAVVRTTHLTGITTDLGIGLAKVITKEANQSDFDGNSLRIGIITFFLLGSFVGSYLIRLIEYYAFLIPALISSLIALKLYRIRKRLEVKV